MRCAALRCCAVPQSARGASTSRGRPRDDPSRGGKVCVVSKPPRPGDAATPASSGAQDRPTNHQATKLQTLCTALLRQLCDSDHRIPAPKFAFVSLILRPATELHPSRAQQHICLRHGVTPDRPSLAVRSYCCTLHQSPRPSHQPLAPTFLFRTASQALATICSSSRDCSSPPRFNGLELPSS